MLAKIGQYPASSQIRHDYTRYGYDRSSMQRYEYRCNECGNTTEIIASYDDCQYVSVVCPACHSDDLSRVYSMPLWVWINGKPS